MAWLCELHFIHNLGSASFEVCCHQARVLTLFALIAAGTLLLAVNKLVTPGIPTTMPQTRPLEGCCAMIKETAPGLSWGSLQCQVKGFLCMCAREGTLPFPCSPACALWKRNLSLADWMVGSKLVCLQKKGKTEGKACKIIKLSFPVQINTRQPDLPAYHFCHLQSSKETVKRTRDLTQHHWQNVFQLQSV